MINMDVSDVKEEIHQYAKNADDDFQTYIFYFVGD